MDGYGPSGDEQAVLHLGDELSGQEELAQAGQCDSRTHRSAARATVALESVPRRVREQQRVPQQALHKFVGNVMVLYEPFTELACRLERDGERDSRVPCND